MSEHEVAVLAAQIAALRDSVESMRDDLREDRKETTGKIAALEERLRKCEVAGAISGTKLAGIMTAASLASGGVVSLLTKMIGG